MKAERCVKESFVVIGKVGSTLDLKSILWMTSNCEQSDKEKLIRELKPVICA